MVANFLIQEVSICFSIYQAIQYDGQSLSFEKKKITE